MRFVKTFMGCIFLKGIISELDTAISYPRASSKTNAEIKQSKSQSYITRISKRCLAYFWCLKTKKAQAPSRSFP